MPFRLCNFCLYFSAVELALHVFVFSFHFFFSLFLFDFILHELIMSIVSVEISVYLHAGIYAAAQRVQLRALDVSLRHVSLLIATYLLLVRVPELSRGI